LMRKTIGLTGTHFSLNEAPKASFGAPKGRFCRLKEGLLNLRTSILSPVKVDPSPVDSGFGLKKAIPAPV